MNRMELLNEKTVQMANKFPEGSAGSSNSNACNIQSFQHHLDSKQNETSTNSSNKCDVNRNNDPKFSTLDEFSWPLDSLIESEEENFDIKARCKTCSSTLTSLSDLINHLKSHQQQKSTEKDQGGENAEKPTEKSKSTRKKEKPSTKRKINKRNNAKASSNDVGSTSTQSEFLCTACGSRFHQLSKLNKHMQMQHLDPKDQKYPCPFPGCSRRFPTAQYLKRHSITHTKETPFSCTFPPCTKSFKAKTNLDLHIKNIHSDTVPHIFKCPEENCDKQFSHKDSLSNHLRVKHTKPGQIARPYVCSFESCGKSFTKSCDKNRHENVHKNAKPFKCPLDSCSKMFNSKSALQFHSKRHHLNERNNTNANEDEGTNSKCLCPSCGLQFSGLNSLKRHIRIHTNEKPYKCTKENCESSFRTGTSLKRHLNAHDNLKSFKCNFCTKGFNSKGPLRRHLQTHTGAKPYKCPICNALFPDNRPLKKHMATQHNIVQPQNSNKIPPVGNSDEIESEDEDEYESDGEERIIVVNS